MTTKSITLHRNNLLVFAVAANTIRPCRIGDVRKVKVKDEYDITSMRQYRCTSQIGNKIYFEMII